MASSVSVSVSASPLPSSLSISSSMRVMDADDLVTLDPAARLQSVTKPPKRPEFLVWKHIDEIQMARILATPNALQLRNELDVCLDLASVYCTTTNVHNTTRRNILLDLAAAIITYGRQCQMTPMKISTFFSIIRTVHMIAAERIDSAPPSLQVSWSLFEDIILRHSVERPPFSIQVFTLHDLRLITQWAANNYFRHMRMYQLVFGGGKRLELIACHSSAQSISPAIHDTLATAIMRPPSPSHATPPALPTK